MISLTLPIRTESEANSPWGEHWSKKNKRRVEQRGAVKYGLYNHRKKLRGHATYQITLTRIAPRVLDGDNLQRSFKAIRDQIAEEIGIDDGSKKIEWQYAQEKGKPKEYVIRVDINFIAEGKEND